MFEPNVFSCLPSSGLKTDDRLHICNSRWEKFGDIRNNLFVQNGTEIAGSLARR